ncbi:SKG6 domain containing protein [Ceratobasidium theobromae]|uniref:SKG6 domain containing protein n=1 Tax=Ceratobasidium theobromae TaxID=1582974 RepID=A0A5N5QUE6_9AGAM|nr:SKG6 domain containing protein [Ceratobasidium theobromae]
MPRRSVWKRAGPACASGAPTWWNNGRGSTPCDVYQSIMDKCSYTAPALTNNDAYYPVSQALLCMCNTVAYNLGSACQDCQRGTTDQGILFSSYVAGGDGCPANTTTLPDEVAPSEEIPLWAYIDTSTQFWTYFDAQQVTLNSTATTTGIATTTHTSSGTAFMPTITLSDPESTSTATSAPSSSKSVNAGAIGGGVAGGVVLVLLVIGLFLFLRRRRARDSHEDSAAVMGTTGGRNPSSSSDSSLTESGKVGGSSGSHYTPHSQMAQLHHNGGSGILIPSHSTASALSTPVDAPVVPTMPREFASPTPARSLAASPTPTRSVTSPTPSLPVVQKVKRVPVRYSEDEIAQAEEEARKATAQSSTGHQ